MSKTARRFLVALMSAILVLVPFVSANAQGNSISMVDVLQQAVSDVDGVDANVTGISSDEAARIWGKVEARLGRTDFYSTLDADGFTETELVVLPAKLSAKDNARYANYHFMKQYTNAAGEMILIEFVYDENTNSLLRVHGQVKKADGSTSQFYDFSEYNPPRTRDFTFDGAAFACSTAGLIACTTYCLAWYLVGGVPGIVCDAACGLAFAAVCAMG